MVTINKVHHTFDWTEEWMYSLFSVTNTSRQTLWGQIRDLQCAEASGEPFHLEPRPLKGNTKRWHLLAIKMNACVCCSLLSRQQSTEKITFELCFWETKSTRNKEPVHVIPMSCTVQTPVGFPCIFNLSCQIKHVEYFRYFSLFFF